MEEFDFTLNDTADVETIHYKLQRCPLASQKAGKNVYHGVVLKKETYGTVQLAKRLASECGLLKEASIRMVLSELANLVGKLVSEGRAVNIGGVVRFMPVIHGTFESSEEPWDPKKHKVRVNACVGTRLRKIAEQSPVTRVGSPDVPTMTRITNMTKPGSDTISSQGKFTIAGKRLEWNVDAADEGWFINIGGEESKCTPLSPQNPVGAVLKCERTFDEPGTPLLLIFRTRLGGKILHQIPYPKPLITA